MLEGNDTANGDREEVIKVSGVCSRTHGTLSCFLRQWKSVILHLPWLVSCDCHGLQLQDGLTLLGVANQLKKVILCFLLEFETDSAVQVLIKKGKIIRILNRK